MTVASLGPRASVLLGLLSMPLTVGELVGIAASAADDSHDELGDLLIVIEDAVGIVQGSLRPLLNSLADPREIRRQLDRLAAAGYVSRIEMGGGASLWWRT